MDDRQLERYSRHILLPQIDSDGQQRLLDATVLIVGAGGLGSPAAMYLAGSGVGHIVVIDHDRVDLSNLHRQILHATPDIGLPKTASAVQALRRINPDIRVTGLETRLAGEPLARHVRDADVVLDASDNFATRFALNTACLEAQTPLVTGAVIRMEGQATVFDGRRPDSPCLCCLYPDGPGVADEGERCAESGVLAPVAGIIGSIMATEALKILAGFGHTLCGRLLRLNAADMDWRLSHLPKDPHCPSCSGQRPVPLRHSGR